MQVINGMHTKPHNQTLTTIRPPLTPLQLLRCAGSEICTLLAGTEGTPPNCNPGSLPVNENDAKCFFLIIKRLQTLSYSKQIAKNYTLYGSENSESGQK